jgi:hypothetical protein
MRFYPMSEEVFEVRFVPNNGEREIQSFDLKEMTENAKAGHVFV